MAKSNEIAKIMKRRGRSMFDVVEQLDTQDAHAKQQQKRIKLDIQRSKAAQSQTKIYSSLLECRILLQRSITQQQKLEQNEKKQSSNVDIVLNNVNCLLVNLLTARQMLQSSNSSRNDHSRNKQTKQPDYYKKLVSVRDDAVTTGTEKELSDVLETEYQSYRQNWKEVLDRRHRDVQLHTGQLTAKSSQFRVIDSSFWQQVEATAQHEQERHKNNNIISNNRSSSSSSRSSRTVQNNELDEEDMNSITKNQHDSATNMEDIVSNRNTPLWNFDDTKVYQQLLKDFVTTASSQTGREEAVAAQERIMKKQQKKNGGMTISSKNLVDRRASKGRKLRYNDIPKLQNFTFPLNRSKDDNSSNSTGKTIGATTLDEAEWFASLFGGRSSWKK